jgi:hypothetical protein
MSEQRHLFDPPPATAHLTDRQAFVYVRLSVATKQGEGLEPDEIGALLCERSRRHDAGSRCAYDKSNGMGVLRALAKRGLAKRRRNVGWVALEVEVEDDSDPFPPGF